MALRPLVLRAHFYHPDLTPMRNFRTPLGHFKYMGNPKKEELVRAGEGDDPRESAAIHAAYMRGRPGSTGYIGPDPDVFPDPEAISDELRHHDGPVWRMFVSVREDDAQQLGLMDRRPWEDAARVVVPEMARRMGIPPERLRWAAAMHRKEGHPHLHLLFWAYPPKRDRGLLAPKELRAVRRLWVQELYRPVREPLAKRMAADRDLVAKGLARELAEVVPAWRVAAGRQGTSAPPRLKASQAEELARRLGAVKALLPGKGRVALAFMPPEVKARVAAVAEWLLRELPEYRQALERHMEAAAQMASHYQLPPEDPALADLSPEDLAKHAKAIETARQNARDRVFDKMGQSILRAAVALQNTERREEVLRIAAAATKGGRRVRGMPLPALPPDLSRHVHAEIQRISHLAPKRRRDEALALARKLLAHPAAAGATRAFRRQLATEAAGKAMPPKWLDEHSSQPLPLPDRFGWLATALANDAAGRTPGTDAAQAWHRQMNAIHQAPPESRREAADRAAGSLLRQPEAKAALAAHLRSVSRAGRAAAYREVRANLARAVDHQVKRLAAQWARDQVAQGMDRLARHVARSIDWAAQYDAFRRANQARQFVLSLYAGLLRQARKEEREAEARALEEEARRKRQVQPQMSM